MKRTGVFVIATLLAQAAAAQVAFLPASETKPIDLFRAAIDSPTGSIRTQVYGQMAQRIQQAIGAPGTPVFAEVKTVHSFKQEGCKRLAMTLSAPNHQMKTSDGGSQPLAATWTLNVCRDGSPPVEGMDMAKAGQVFDKGVKPVPLPRAQ